MSACDLGISPHIITDWYGTSLSTAYFQVKKVMKVYYSKALRKEKKNIFLAEEISLPIYERSKRILFVT